MKLGFETFSSFTNKILTSFPLLFVQNIKTERRKKKYWSFKGRAIRHQALVSSGSSGTEEGPGLCSNCKEKAQDVRNGVNAFVRDPLIESTATFLGL